MFREKYFRFLMVIYVLICCFMIGLIIHKFTADQEKVASPVVSFHLDITKNMSPERLVEQFYKFIEMDEQAIISEGIPVMKNPQKQGIMGKVTEPTDLFNKLFYWTIGIDLKKPTSYLTTTIPSLDYHLNNVQPDKAEPDTWDSVQAIYTKPQVIKGDRGNIYINIPPEELNLRPPTRPEIEPQVPEPKESVEIIQHKPRVLIYHTHTSETYIDDPNPQDQTCHALLPHTGKIVQVGETLAKALREAGIEVVHDQTSYDGEHFSAAYTNARRSLSTQLGEHSYDIILDLHRDGNNMNSQVSRDQFVLHVNNKTAARILLLVPSGKVDFVDEEESFQSNIRFCAALVEEMQEMYPGLLRDIIKRDNRRYNLDLHPHAQLIEVGYHLNTTAEALYTAQLLADVIVQVLKENPAFLIKEQMDDII